MKDNLKTPHTKEEIQKEKKDSNITLTKYDRIKSKLREKWKQWLIVLFCTIFLGYITLYFLPGSYTDIIMSRYQGNSTYATIHTSTGTNFLIALVTFLYVLLTATLVTQSREAIVLSNKAIEQSQQAIKQSQEANEIANAAITQSRNEQKIRDIENKLEKFYIPADDIINNPLTNPSKSLVIKGTKETLSGGETEEDFKYLELQKKKLGDIDGLKHLRKYSYLADKTTYEAYDKYLKARCTEVKNEVCGESDQYSNCKFAKGDVAVSHFCGNKREKCPYNLNYCKCNPERDKYPTNGYKQDNIELESNNTYCIANETECKYFIYLKKKIKEDIMNYGEMLLKLKDNEF